MLLGAANRNELIVPGPLTSHHAQVLARTEVSQRCAACHPGANDGTTDWLATAVAGHDGMGQSALCLDCHQELAKPGADPLLAHGIPSESLPETATHSIVSLASFSRLGKPAHGRSAAEGIACAVCHQEHHGAEHNLSAITDARCQACHTERYDSFAEDHPEFAVWPTTRRTRIRFNHASHQSQHHVKANQTFDCRGCHLEDATGDLTPLASYQQSCAECHEPDLVRSFDEGLAFLSLPTIDREAIADAQVDLSRWPPERIGDFDGDVSLFTKLLLAADHEAAEAFETLGADFSFFDIDRTDPEQVKASVGLIRALQRLVDDLQEEGHDAITSRLKQLSDNSEPSASKLVAGLPTDLIDQLQRIWFGGVSAPRAFDAINDRRTGGGWYLDSEQFTLAYRPTGHDDPLMRAWIDTIVALPAEQAALREACLAELTRPGAPGRCFECHSLERQADERLGVNWQGRQRLAEPRQFTHFSHRPHLVQKELADCSHCHQLDAAADLSANYAGNDPSRFKSEFVAINKADCTSCHQPHAAGDRCTQCHHYHVDAATPQ